MNLHPTTPSSNHEQLLSWENISPDELLRRREWNRGPLSDFFPRIPSKSLETVLDICISKNFVYQLSQPRWWNALRYTSIVIAHLRHNYTEYDALLRGEGGDGGGGGGGVVHGEKVERYEARRRTGEKVWKVLREWCPWDDSNDQLERCFQATLMRQEERGAEWDPMDLDDEYELDNRAGPVDDPMDLD
ncbi:hypothetical protein D0869_01192 [Hortaea werneckii]|uniref:DUF2293 domain-containing protein n=1 Tax=Hortaea werneckii TaxID=91943 RepID=A0A3M6XEK4_HORWE|nr:hypothetical protein KC324_g2746 [Hortaea werneckii]KAI7589450.1 hypothetical protein KC316_g3942 [Hortaea werneckii]RMX89006.1 hypothetical protein D0869_01192 [Hortaea werneckii]RMY15450.1 hypothetical protein D0868_00878 [Hortaea werneckii]